MYDVTLSGTTATLNVLGTDVATVTCTGHTASAYYLSVRVQLPLISLLRTTPNTPLNTTLRPPPLPPPQVDIYCAQEEASVCWGKHAIPVPMLKFA